MRAYIHVPYSQVKISMWQHTLIVPALKKELEDPWASVASQAVKLVREPVSKIRWKIIEEESQH